VQRGGSSGGSGSSGSCGGSESHSAGGICVCWEYPPALVGLGPSSAWAVCWSLAVLAGQLPHGAAGGNAGLYGLTSLRTTQGDLRGQILEI
jgi:hypothetical protein